MKKDAVLYAQRLFCAGSPGGWSLSCVISEGNGSYPERLGVGSIDPQRRCASPSRAANQSSQGPLRQIANPSISAVQISLKALSESLQLLWRINAPGDHIPEAAALQIFFWAALLPTGRPWSGSAAIVILCSLPCNHD